MLQKKLNELGKLIESAPTSPEVIRLAREIKSECRSTEEEAMVEEFVGSHMPKLTASVESLHEDAVKLQLEEVSDMLNLSYIARKYFKKSRAWLSQRVNGSIVNGKPCRFTARELDTLNNALRDMSSRLSAVTVRY